MELKLDSNLHQFVVIIGEGVTKGARSPLLWNRAFCGLDINAKMFPVDVYKDDNVNNILDKFFQDPKFLGGAVGAPLKLDVSRYVSKKSNPNNQNIITPVNCFFRSADGAVEAVNTDILAAKESIEGIKPLVDFRKIAILGNGAIAQGLCKELIESNDVDISVFRRNPASDELLKTLGCAISDMSVLSNTIGEYDLIVNCTSIGKDGSLDETPISEENIRDIDKKCLIFDVNYINSPSKLLRISKALGLNTIDGVRMNLTQAAIGFHLATGAQYEITKILELMKEG